MDIDFIQSNGLPSPSLASIVQTLFTLGCVTIMLLLPTQWGECSWRFVYGLWILFFAGLGAHVLNIRWRVNHHIQTHLQMNVFENLVKQLSSRCRSAGHA